MAPTTSNFIITSFIVILFCRVLAALCIPIADCDETYNYWEPAHLLTYGSGKMTWEYSPVYALRSWLFVWIYAWPGVVLTRIFGPDFFSKIAIYYVTRVLAALASSLVETYFLAGVAMRFGDRAARIAMVLLCSSAGMANAAASFLPSTFAMCNAFVAGGAILRLEVARCDADDLGAALATAEQAELEETEAAEAAVATSPTHASASSADAPPPSSPSSSAVILRGAVKTCHVAIQRNSVRCIWAAVIGAVIGWPFAALSVVPLALVVLVRCRPFFFYPAREAAAALIACGVAVTLLDSIYYCKRQSPEGAFSTWNLIRYNVLASDDPRRGPELYGVEPWHFFFRNLVLNFNLVFGLCLLSVVWSSMRITARWSAAAVVKMSGGGNNNVNKNIINNNRNENNNYNDNSSDRKKTRQPPPALTADSFVSGAKYQKDISNLILAAPFVLWFVFWLRIPHKEERFMVPAYPFLVLPAAVLLGEWWDWSFTAVLHHHHVHHAAPPASAPPAASASSSSSSSSSSSNNHNDNNRDNNNSGTNASQTRKSLAREITLSQRAVRLICSLLVTVSIVGGVSRSLALWRYYGETERSVQWLYKHIENKTATEAAAAASARSSEKKHPNINNNSNKKIINVCVGKEWFRFPPSYFLPRNARMVFVESSSFLGALPRDFAEGTLNATCEPTGTMNDLNMPEPGQSIARSQVRAVCDYVVDTTLGDGGKEMRNAAAVRLTTKQRSNTKSSTNVMKKNNREDEEEEALVGFNVLRSKEILDAAATPFYLRAFYVPVFAESRAHWGRVIVASIEPVKEQEEEEDVGGGNRKR